CGPATPRRATGTWRRETAVPAPPPSDTAPPPSARSAARPGWGPLAAASARRSGYRRERRNRSAVPLEERLEQLRRVRLGAADLAVDVLLEGRGLLAVEQADVARALARGQRHRGDL